MALALTVSLHSLSVTWLRRILRVHRCGNQVLHRGHGLPQQHGSIWSPSAVLQPEFPQEWNDSRDRFTAISFLRLDADRFESQLFRYAGVQRLSPGLQLGFPFRFRRVLPGVVESRRLLNIVNQRDLVENLDEEDKLGLSNEFNNLNLFVLPGFWERTFIGRRGSVAVPATGG